MQSAPKSLLLDDEDPPLLSKDQVDLSLHDGDKDYQICSCTGPRQNAERPRIQYHDRRSSRKRQADPRTAKQIIQALRLASSLNE